MSQGANELMIGQFKNGSMARGEAVLIKPNIIFDISMGLAEHIVAKKASA